MRPLGAVVAALFAFLAPVLARAGDAPGVTFALIVGVNQGPDHDLLPLRYADDDAAQYRDLFRTVGAQTYLLTTMDDNTRRLHPEAAIEAVPAQFEQFTAAVTAIADGVRRARSNGVPTTLYVLYAGHGADDGRSGYVMLEDRHLSGPDLLEQVFDRINAETSHLIVDACSAYLLVMGRGRGGQRRALQGFAHIGEALLERPDIGLLLSTSSARESHEWAAFQAGVFSHEVRSGLFGAADASGDGIIDYDEMGAFIARANESIPNDRFRPEVFWRAPRTGAALLDIRSALAHRVEIGARDNGHYYLEDPRGVRLADFHNGKSLNVRLLRPAGASHLYLQRTWDGREYLLPAAPAIIDTSTLTPQEPHVSIRSAAHEAFAVLFALPFEGAKRAPLSAPLGLSAGAERSSARAWDGKRVAGWICISAAAVAAVVSAELLVSARSLQSESDGTAHVQQQAAVDTRGATVAAAIAGASALTGAAMLVWPASTPAVSTAHAAAGPRIDRLMFGWRGRF